MSSLKDYLNKSLDKIELNGSPFNRYSFLKIIQNGIVVDSFYVLKTAMSFNKDLRFTGYNSSLIYQWHDIVFSIKYTEIIGRDTIEKTNAVLTRITSYTILNGVSYPYDMDTVTPDDFLSRYNFIYIKHSNGLLYGDTQMLFGNVWSATVCLMNARGQYMSDKPVVLNNTLSVKDAIANAGLSYTVVKLSGGD